MEKASLSSRSSNDGSGVGLIKAPKKRSCCEALLVILIVLFAIGAAASFAFAIYHASELVVTTMLIFVLFAHSYDYVLHSNDIQSTFGSIMYNYLAYVIWMDNVLSR